MPFGLNTAPAKFQRLANALFSGLKGLELQAFVDDLCLASNSWQEHLALLEKVFKIVIESNLKLKCSKCVFGARRITFLGHIISEKGVEQDPDKTKAIEEMPKPKDINGVRCILGLGDTTDGLCRTLPI